MNTKQETTIHKPKIYKLNKVLRKAVRQNTSMNIVDMDAWTTAKEEGIESWRETHLLAPRNSLSPIDELEERCLWSSRESRDPHCLEALRDLTGST